MKNAKLIFDSFQPIAQLPCKYGHFWSEGRGRSAYPWGGERRDSTFLGGKNPAKTDACVWARTYAILFLIGWCNGVCVRFPFVQLHLIPKKSHPVISHPIQFPLMSFPTTGQFPPPVISHHRSFPTTEHFPTPDISHHRTFPTTGNFPPPDISHHRSFPTTGQFPPPDNSHPGHFPPPDISHHRTFPTTGHFPPPVNRARRLPQKFIHPRFFIYSSKVCIIVQPITILVQ